MFASIELNSKRLRCVFAASCAAASLLAATHASARAGDVDPRFGSAGTLVTEYPGGGMGFTRLKDGKLLFRGMKVTKANPAAAIFGPAAEAMELVKIDDRGQLDAGFGKNGVLRLLTPGTSGPLLVSGPGELFDWSPGLKRYEGFREMPDGSLLFLGAGVHQGKLVRLNADGSYDTRFGNAGVRTLPSSNVCPSCGYIILARMLGDDGSEYSAAAVLPPAQNAIQLEATRVSPQGVLDTAYVEASRVALRNVVLEGGLLDLTTPLKLNDAGQLLIGTTKALVRLTREGNLDTTFGVGGMLEAGTSGFEYGMTTGQLLFQKDGSTIVSARLTDSRVGSTIRVAANGLVDASFNRIQIANSYPPLPITEASNSSCIGPQVDTLGIYRRADDTLISLAFEAAAEACKIEPTKFYVRQFQPNGAKYSELVVDIKAGNAGGVPWEYLSPVRHPTIDGNAILLPTSVDPVTKELLPRAAVTRILIADDIPAPRAEGAWWAGAAENGWGFSLVQSGNTLAAGWYYYDDAGQPTWAIMPGCTWDASYNVCTGQVTSATGSWLGNYDASKYTPTVIGSATLRFNGAGAATFEWDIGGKKATKTVTRLAFGSGVAPTTANYTGIWSGGAAQNGWGLALFQQQATIAGAWYTYDNAGKPVWYLINGGGWMPDGSYAAQLVRATGSPLIGATYNAAAFTPQQAGTLTLKFAADGTGTMTYAVDGVTQTKTISRLQF